VYIQVEFFYAVVPCSVTVGYQCFRVKSEAARSSKMVVSYCITIQFHKPENLNLKVFRMHIPNLMVQYSLPMFTYNMVLEKYEVESKSTETN